MGLDDRTMCRDMDDVITESFNISDEYTIYNPIFVLKTENLEYNIMLLWLIYVTG